MAKFFLLSLSLLILFYGCKKEAPTAPVTPLTGNGAIIMKIDRQNAPSGVESVTAYLFRTGSDTLVSNLNFITDSSASLSFNTVPTGVWQLRVDAASNTGVILYSGQASLEVFANQVTTLNLTLMPVPGLTGSVLINVTWGAIPPGWIDNYTNPLLFPSSSQYDFGGVLQPYVIFDGTKYRMWYVGLVNSARTYCMYAESNDGRNWVKMNDGAPVFYPSLNGFDNGGVSPGAIIKDGDAYKMYYTGTQGTYSNWQVGLAVSQDGISWERFSMDPIITANSNEFQIIPSSILKINGIYMLYYTSRNYPIYTINIATSSDGVHFQRYANNPILTATQPWEGSGILEASVIFENNQFKMVYSNSSDPQSGFGYATSADGYNWQKAQNNPFFRNINSAGNWASGSVAYPNYLKTPAEYRVYYSGYNPQNSIYKIGYVKKPL